MKKLLMKKSKGYVVTLEMLSAVLIWSALMSSTVYVINSQRWQKIMYTSFCSAAIQTSKWGGTDTNIRAVNGKTQDIAEEMERNIKNYSGVDVDINITPKEVTASDNMITVTLTWTPRNNAWGGIFSPGIASRSHTIKGTFDSIAKPGKLI